MIYLIVANQIMEVLTDMDEALEEARHYAPKVGDITVADVATGRKLIVTADGKSHRHGCEHEGGEQVSKKFKVIAVYWLSEGSGSDLITLANIDILENLLNDGYRISQHDTVPGVSAASNIAFIGMPAVTIYILEKEDEGMK